MAAGQVHGLQINERNGNEDGSQILLITGLGDGRTCEMPEVLDNLAPAELTQPSVALRDFNQFRALWSAFYQTLVVKQHPTQPGVNIVATNFGNNDVLQAIREAAPALSEVSRSPLGLYHTLRLLKQFELARTRNHMTALTDAMTDEPLNVALGVSLGLPTDDNTQSGFYVNMYLRLITHILSSISHLHGKARAGLEAWVWFQAAISELAELKMTVQDMLLTLKPRSDANQSAQRVGSARLNCIQSLREFTSGVNQVHQSNALLYLNSLQVHQTVSFTQGPTCLQTLSNGTIWAHYFDIRNLDISGIQELAQIGSDLDPLLEKIRGYQPSRLDEARDQARSIKPNIVKLLDQIDLFFQSEVQSKGAAKSILLQIDGIRGLLQKLQSDGLQLDEDTVGTDQLSLERHYAKLTDFISSFEQKQRLEETQRKLELQELSKASSNVQLKLRPLTGVSTWLQFSASMEEILSLHQSSLVKAQLIRNALKVQEDQNSCRDLSYDEIISWLENKYSDSSLLPKLCDELLLLPQAGESFKQSYENLNTFFITVHHLKKYNALERLEKSYRDKLVSILLAEIHQATYLAKKYEKEIEWKSELSGEPTLPDDDNQSIVSESQDPQLEGRRLTFFISQMKFFLPQAYQLSKTQKIKKNTAISSAPRTRNKTHFHATDANQTCPVCLTPHTDPKSGQVLVSLSRCAKFRSMDVQARISVVKRAEYCKKCLRPRQAGDGIHDNNNCRLATERSMACKNHDPPSPSHHYLLCLYPAPGQPGAGGEQSQRGAGGGSYRGRGGRGGRGRGAGRGANTSSANVSDQTQTQTPPSSGNTVQFSASSYPLPRLICNKLSSHQHSSNNINLEKTRAFLSSACFVLALSLGTHVSLLSMMDSGSGLGFISEQAVKMLNPTPARPWTGEISTLHQNKLGTWPTFIVPLLDIFNNVHHIRLIAAPTIGFKDIIPKKIFNDICHSFSLSPNAVQNTSGAYDILLGIDSFMLHGDRSNVQSQKYPDVYLMSSILSQKQYLIGSVGANLYRNQTARTMTFSISTKPQSNVTAPVAAQILLNRNYLKNFFISAFLSSFSCSPDGSGSRRTSPPDCSNHVQHMLQCSRNNAYVSFDTKKSAASIDFELTQPAPQVVCQQCSQIILKCSTCKYISQAISIKDMEELNILRQCIRLDKQPDDRVKVFVKYPQRKDPNIIFSASNSNLRVAKQSSIRLRQTLLKRGLLDQFHIMMEKTLNDGHSEEIDYSPSDEPCNYISLNYQEKSSESQPLRPVSNSSLPNKTGESLNSNSLSGPPWLGSGLKCLIAFRERLIGYHSDISKFYRSVFTDSLTNDLRRYFWYSDPRNEQTLKCYRFIRGNYGDTSISILTEIIVREYVADACQTEHVSSACRSQRIVDDFCSSVESLEMADQVRHDLITTFHKFYFAIKHFHYTGMKLEDDKDPKVSVLGLLWCLNSDQLYVKTEFFPEKKKRGRNQGEQLSRESAKTLLITKEVLARLSGLAFCYSGVLLGPVQACLRISYSQLCQLTQSWTTPCHVLDPALDIQIRQMLGNISDLQQRIKPFPRHVSGAGYVPFRIIGCSDGAKLGLGFTFHLVSRDTVNNKFISNIILARPAVHKLSIPASELAALTKAVKSFDEVWGSLQDWSSHQIELIFLTDSTCTAASLSMTKTFSDVRTRNSNITIHRVFSEIVQNYKNINIKVAHCEGIRMPGDYLTRLVPDPVDLINSDLYRHGNDSWGLSAWPKPENTYLKYSHGAPPEFQNAVPEQHTKHLGVQCTQPAFHTAHNNNNTQASLAESIPVLSEQIYKYLFSKYSKLKTMLHVMSILYSWVPSKAGWSRGHLDNFVFKTIIKSHQHFYNLPRGIKSMLPRKNGDGIYITTTRLDCHTADVMDVRLDTPILNKNDTLLTNMIIYHSHQQCSSLLAKLHLGSTLTAASIRGGPYAVWFPGITSAVRKYISQCGLCNFIHRPAPTSELSAPRFLKHLASNDVLWKFLSIDDQGPYLRRTHPGSRAFVKFWILTICDLVVGCVNFELMEKRDRQSVHRALYNHCTAYSSEPYHVFTDGAAWIAPQPLSEDGRKYFKTDFKVTQFTTNHQFLNKSEHFVKLYRRLTKSVFCEREKAQLPNQTYTETRCLLNSVKNVINSRPIYRQGSDNFILTPNHLLFPHSFFEKSAVKLSDGANPENIKNLLSLTENLEQNLKILGNSLKLNYSFFIGILKQLFSLDNQKSVQRKEKFSYQPKDLVLLLLPDNFCRGVVISAENQHALVVSSRNSGEPERWHNSRLVLLYRDLPDCTDQPSARSCPEQPGSDSHNTTSSRKTKTNLCRTALMNIQISASN